MKTAQLRLLPAACLLVSLTLGTLAPRAHAGPAVTAKQALQLAEEALAAKNPDKDVYLESLALQRSSLLGGKSIWIVSWSSSIPGSKPGSQEVGLEIGMDGSVVHVIKARGKAKLPQVQPHEIGR